MNFFAQHRDLLNFPDLQNADFEFHLSRLRPVIDMLASRDKMLSNWYLQGNSVKEALRYRVYGDDHQPLQQAIDEFNKEYRGESQEDPKVIGMWNGAELDEDGATFLITIDGGNVLSQKFDFDIYEKENGLSRLGDYRSVAQIIAKIVELYSSFYVMYCPRPYFEKQIFADRPGVGWMLYLPHTLTSAEVPEAGDLIPVMLNGKQQGTIIVSVTDSVFNLDNLEHIKNANDIEIRLADQHLLPRLFDL